MHTHHWLAAGAAPAGSTLINAVRKLHVPILQMRKLRLAKGRDLLESHCLSLPNFLLLLGLLSLSTEEAFAPFLLIRDSAQGKSWPLAGWGLGSFWELRGPARLGSAWQSGPALIKVPPTHPNLVYSVSIQTDSRAFWEHEWPEGKIPVRPPKVGQGLPAPMYRQAWPPGLFVLQFLTLYLPLPRGKRETSRLFSLIDLKKNTNNHFLSFRNYQVSETCTTSCLFGK